MPPKYEYKAVLVDAKYEDVEITLNSYGNDGWELVSAYDWGNSNPKPQRPQFYFKRELQQEPQVDETEVNTDEILSGMNNLNVDTEPPAPTPGGFTFGTPAPASENPPDAGTEVEILHRDLDDLRTDFDKVRRKVGKSLGGIGLRTKEEEFEDIKRPNCGFTSNSNHCSFVDMTFEDYRAWKSEFETYYREQIKQRELETERYEEQQIAKDRLEAELQRVLAIEHEAEKMAKLRAYNEAEAEAKAQKEHFTRTGEFMSKSE